MGEAFVTQYHGGAGKILIKFATFPCINISNIILEITENNTLIEQQKIAYLQPLLHITRTHNFPIVFFDSKLY